MSTLALQAKSYKASLSKPTCPIGISEAQGPAFLCTICWQNQPLGSKPKLLGTSARIVCYACWCAVLDLSICWVCGDCIVRGDEAVSLGWCFWHRSCFGCLICKTKISVPKTENWGRRYSRRGEGIMDGSEDGTSTLTGDNVRRCMGIELEEVPLCRVCKVETADEPSDHLLQRGLEMVTKSDGGLSRDRLDMLDERMAAHTPRTKIHLALAPRHTMGPRASEIGRDLGKYINDGVKINIASYSQASMTDGAQSTDGLQIEDELALSDLADQMVCRPEEMDADGATLVDHTHSDSEEADIGNQQPIRGRHDVDEDVYLSIFNPLGQPAFKPSRTKPLPQWMRLLPSNVHRERGKPKYTPRARSLESLKSLYELQTLVPNTPIAIEAFANPLESFTCLNSPATAVTNPAAESPGTVTPSEIIRLTLIKTSPKIKFGAADTSSISASVSAAQSPEILDSLDDSSTEFESEDEHVPQRPKTPFPRMYRPTLMKSETSSYSNHCIVTEPRTIHEILDFYDVDMPPTPPLSLEKNGKLTQRIARWKLLGPPARDSRPLSQSCEYLERYQPTLTRTTYYSNPAPKTPEPILEKIRRQRDARKRLAQEMNGEKELNHGKGIESPEMRCNIAGFRGVDPTSNLHQELRNLFREE